MRRTTSMVVLMAASLTLGALTIPANGAARVAAGGPCTINGTNGDDNPLMGTPGDDVICAKDGHDLIKGKGGNDTIYGGDGRDHIRGGAGNDTIYGGLGPDTIIADAGDDTAYGGRGGDILDGNRGDDILRGQRGADSLRGFEDDDVLRGAKGTDCLYTVDGVGGNDSGYGGDGYDYFQIDAGDFVQTVEESGNCGGD